ncbi:hypothetical protein T05_4430 [Trichinella murrelli]|uniref:Uncharacterized protein n=1 Tax=Trichinella murrelli TaxID=144512 RepID=A0A0V0T7M0_9BILA|nr:hypothetical protein T05_4430 [Trichinella murrelli]
MFWVSRLHSLQRPCGPVRRIWFTPSNWMSANCDIKPDATLGDEIRSDRWKPTRPCRQNTRGLCDLSSMKQLICQAATVATFTARTNKGQYHFLPLIVRR